MANAPSAQKRNRQRLKRRERNVHHLSTMRTLIKRVRAALVASDGEAAGKALSPALRALDKAAQKGVIPAKTAARKKSRLTLGVLALSE